MLWIPLCPPLIPVLFRLRHPKKKHLPKPIRAQRSPPKSLRRSETDIHADLLSCDIFLQPPCTAPRKSHCLKDRSAKSLLLLPRDWKFPVVSTAQAAWICQIKRVAENLSEVRQVCLHGKADGRQHTGSQPEITSEYDPHFGMEHRKIQNIS